MEVNDFYSALSGEMLERRPRKNFGKIIIDSIYKENFSLISETLKSLIT